MSTLFLVSAFSQMKVFFFFFSFVWGSAGGFSFLWAQATAVFQPMSHSGTPSCSHFCTSVDKLSESIEPRALWWKLSVFFFFFLFLTVSLSLSSFALKHETVLFLSCFFCVFWSPCRCSYLGPLTLLFSFLTQALKAVLYVFALINRQTTL